MHGYIVDSIQNWRVWLLLKKLLFASVACFGVGACAVSPETVENAAFDNNSPVMDVTFSNITEDIGLTSHSTWKYGGPSVSDLNGDGLYDFLLTNHHVMPAQLFWGEADGTLSESIDFYDGDVHGIAPGDFDQDGDNDVLVSLGGGNGAKPRPPLLLRNDDGKFVDIAVEAGISELGARGRTVRWVDMDLDGDLDFLQINARQVIGEDKPRNILFENIGDGKFEYHESGAFEKTEAERVLLTDIDGDSVSDLITFSPLAVWKGGSDFTFTDVTEDVLPEELSHAEYVMAVSEADVDNDGDYDLYVARGKTYYEIAQNSYQFRKDSKRLDIRDEGNKSHDGIGFVADSNVVLSQFTRWGRGNNDLPFPVFLGSEKTILEVPEDPEAGSDSGKLSTGVPGSIPVTVSKDDAIGFPETFKENGWYLGYLGDGKWRMEWHLDHNLAWDIRASVSNVSEVLPDWEPQDIGVPDILLENVGGKFVDASGALPAESGENNWGVTNGDFNNDGNTDFFVYRFGELNTRLPDAMLLNKGGFEFEKILTHGATVLDAGGHGDMGAAFDYDYDGAVDLLNGDDDNGKWYMFKNDLLINDNTNYVLVRVGYSLNGIDAHGAELVIETEDNTYHRRVGGAGAVHSQSLLNVAHFGLAEEKLVKSVKVKWRSGESQTLSNVDANQMVVLGTNPLNGE